MTGTGSRDLGVGARGPMWIVQGHDARNHLGSCSLH